MSRNLCRLCLSESDFNVSLFGNYSRKTNIVEKILVCLKVVVEDTDPLTTICYKCAGNVEKYYDFITVIKKSQNRLNFSKSNERQMGLLEESFNRRPITCMRQQVIGANSIGDYTISFLEPPKERKEKSSTPLFSHFSPPNVVKQETNWKTPRHTKAQRQKNCSRDIFDTQSQGEQKGLEWNLTPDDNIIKRFWKEIFRRSQNL